MTPSEILTGGYMDEDKLKGFKKNEKPLPDYIQKFGPGQITLYKYREELLNIEAKLFSEETP